METIAKEKATTIVCLLVSIIVALTYGFTFFESNQNTYLLGSLSAFGIEPLVNDWLVSTSQIYHSTFSYIIRFFAYTGLNVAVLSMVFDFILRVLAYYFFIKSISPKYEKAQFSLLIGIFLVFDGAISVGGSYLFSIIFQPSTLGAAFTVLSVACYFSNRNLFASLFVVVAGVFHANFLILMTPILTLSFLLDYLSKKGSIKSGLLLLLPMWVFLLLRLPSFFGYVGSGDEVDTDYLFQFIRSPHHYNTNTFLPSFVELLGWAVVGFTSLLGLGDRDERILKVRSLYISLGLALVFAFIFTSPIYISFVSKVFIWRVAPVFELLSYAAISLFVISRKFRLEKGSIIFVAVGLLLVVLGKVEEWELSRKIIVILLFLSAFTVYYFMSIKYLRVIKYLSVPVFVLVFFTYGIYSAYSVHINSSKYGIGTVPQSRVDIYDWIKEKTESDSVFQTPLYFEDFRLKAQRAMVVDWKSTPVDPLGLAEWYRRVLAVSCVEFSYYNISELHGCYDNTDTEKVGKVSELYGAKYFIFKNSTYVEFLIPVYTGDKYTIYTDREF